jgi:hypothetical protein
MTSKTRYQRNAKSPRPSKALTKQAVAIILLTIAMKHAGVLPTPLEGSEEAPTCARLGRPPCTHAK